jgi:hypothetical protein
LQHFFGDLLNAFGDRPAMLRLKGEGVEDQQVERSMDEIGRFAHGFGTPN